MDKATQNLTPRPSYVLITLDRQCARNAVKGEGKGSEVWTQTQAYPASTGGSGGEDRTRRDADRSSEDLQRQPI